MTQQAIGLATALINERMTVNDLAGPQREAAERYFADDPTWLAWIEYRRQISAAESRMQTSVSAQFAADLPPEQRNNLQKEAKAAFVEVIRLKERWLEFLEPAVIALAKMLA